LANDISSTGHVTVYGIYFEMGKADLKPESEATLKEIAKLLQQDANLKLYVVGHTDNQGALTLNMDLSKRRADSVVAASRRPNIHCSCPFRGQRSPIPPEFVTEYLHPRALSNFVPFGEHTRLSKPITSEYIGFPVAVVQCSAVVAVDLYLFGSGRISPLRNEPTRHPVGGATKIHAVRERSPTALNFSRRRSAPDHNCPRKGATG